MSTPTTQDNQGQASQAVTTEAEKDTLVDACISNETNTQALQQNWKKKHQSLFDEILGDDPHARYRRQLEEMIDIQKCKKGNFLKGNFLTHGEMKIYLKGSSELLSLEQKNGQEKIFVRGASLFTGMSPQAADAAIKLAIARGWQKMSVSGPVQKKEELWYAAMVNGLEVTNYLPSSNSPTWERLKLNHPQIIEAMTRKNEESRRAAMGASAPATEKPAEPEKPAETADTFQRFLKEKETVATSKEEAEGLRQLSAALASGKLKLDDVEKTVFKGTYDSTSTVDGKPVGGYNNALKIIEASARRQNVDIKFPKAPETAEPRIVLPAASRPKEPGI